MAAASFNGNSLGLCPRTTSRPLPYRVQRNYYPGVDGWQTIRMGSAGVEVSITARIYAPDATSFGAQYSLFETLVDGNIYQLTDTYGRTPAGGAELVAFGPAEPKVIQDPTLGFSLLCTFTFLVHP